MHSWNSSQSLCLKRAGTWFVFCFHNCEWRQKNDNHAFQSIALLLGHRPHLLQLTHELLGVFSSVARCRIWVYAVDLKMAFVWIFWIWVFVQSRAEELDLNSARPFQMNGVYSVKSSIFLGSAANYDSASSCIISSTWSGSCSPMAPLLWTILGSPEHLQIWRSLWGKSKKNMV